MEALPPRPIFGKHGTAGARTLAVWWQGPAQETDDRAPAPPRRSCHNSLSAPAHSLHPANGEHASARCIGGIGVISVMRNESARAAGAAELRSRQNRDFQEGTTLPRLPRTGRHRPLESSVVTAKDGPAPHRGGDVHSACRGARKISPAWWRRRSPTTSRAWRRAWWRCRPARGGHHCRRRRHRHCATTRSSLRRRQSYHERASRRRSARCVARVWSGTVLHGT